MSVMSKLSIAASKIDHRVKGFLFELLDNNVVTAAGSTQADAVALTAGTNLVLAADGSVGVKLPKAIEGASVTVVNTVSDQTLKVYAEVSEQINAITTTDPYSLTAGGAVTFHCDVVAHWYAPVSNATGTSTSATTAELDLLAGVTAGTAIASKAVTTDANIDTTGQRNITITGSYIIGSASMDETDLEKLDGITNGTVAANKAIVPTTDKHIDALVISDGGLALGAGAGTAVSATAAELNYNDIAALGTGAASKAVVLDAGEDYTWPDTGVLTIGVLATATEAAEHGAGAIGTAATPTTKRWIERGGIIVTQTTVDLTGLASVATANDVIGLAVGGAAYIGRNVEATNGVIFKVEFACLETPLTGDNDVNVVANANAALAYDGAGGTTYLSDSGDLLKGQTIQNLLPALTEGDYFYLTAGTGDTAATYTAGMYVLTTYGHAVLA